MCVELVQCSAALERRAGPGNRFVPVGCARRSRDGDRDGDKQPGRARTPGRTGPVVFRLPRQPVDEEALDEKKTRRI